MKIKLLKLLDQIIGLPAVRLLSSPKRKLNRVISQILFIRPGGIGDAVLLIPVIQFVKRTYPKATVTVLAEKRNAAVFQLYPDVNSLLHYDSPAELFNAIRGSYDLVIDTEQWHRMSAIIARMTNAPRSIGFATNERKKLFTDPVDYSHDKYEVLNFFNLLTPLMGEVPAQFKVPFLTIPPTATFSADNLFPPAANSGFVALFPGGSITERKWGSLRFHELASLFVNKGYSIVVLGGKEDLRAGEEIVGHLPHSYNLCGKTTLPQTAALLKKTLLLVSGDSGVMHIGYGLGTKIVALFGPGREKKWAPRGEHCITINKNLVCSPCTTFGYTAKCKLNALCMSSVSVEDVYKAAAILLNGSDRSE